MELGIIGIIVAIILFIIGLKIAKWIFWGLAIILAVIGTWLWIF